MRQKIDFPIDFVIPWVDGTDPVWQSKRNKWIECEEDNESDFDQRYTDWGTIKYLLRSIEKFAPWVHRVFLVTDNQKPEWLNTQNITVVDHTDFIPQEFLPTFNSNVIEMNVDRINELSEHFVLLNDDLLFTQMTTPSDFFNSKGQEVDVMAQSILMPRDQFSHTAVNNITLINQRFSKRKWLKKYWRSALSFKNGFAVTVLSILLSPLPYVTRFYDPHIGIPYTKTNFRAVKELFPDATQTLMHNRTRMVTDISHWLVRYYQIMTGKVTPHTYHFGQYLSLQESEHLQQVIDKPRKARMIVLNDAVISDKDRENVRQSMQILQDKFDFKSRFEV